MARQQVRTAAAPPAPTTPCLGWELLRAPHWVSTAHRGCLGLRPWERRNPARLGAFSSFLRQEPLSTGAAMLQPSGSQ